MVNPMVRKNPLRAGRVLSVICLGLLATQTQAGPVPGGYLDVAGRASNLGLGAEVGYAIENTNFNIRVQINQFDQDYDLEEDDIEYEADIELSTFGVLADWHPFGGAFRVTAGLFNNNNKLSGAATGAGTYEIGEETFEVDPSDNFRLAADIELGDGIAPYAGVGWGFSPKNKGGLLITADLGLLLQGSPSVDLSASGTATYQGVTVDLATDPTAQEQVSIEEKRLEDDISEFDVYPVVSIGVGFRF